MEEGDTVLGLEDAAGGFGEEWGMGTEGWGPTKVRSESDRRVWGGKAGGGKGGR